LFKILAYAALIISLFFLAIIGFSQVWYVIALFSLVFFVYVVSFDKSDSFKDAAALGLEQQPQQTFRRIPVTSLVVLLISLVFILSGASIGAAISDRLNIVQVEARPSWAATISVAKQVMSSDPIFGSGPNRFSEKWLMYKPEGINSTVFWNTDFTSGVGFVPTFFVTTGILGTLGWLAFLSVFLFIGFRAILSAIGDKVSRYLVASSFLASLFLWIINVFYTPSLSIVALTFFFTGLFVASLCQSGIIKQKTLSFIEDPKAGFVSVLVLILLLIGTIASGYSLVGKFISSVYFQKGVLAFSNEGNVDRAESYLSKAISFNDESWYQRSFTQIDMTRLAALLPQTNTMSQDALRTQFGKLFSSALSHSEQAIALEPTNYQNWLSLGQVYEAVVPLKIQNAYESANNAYNQALALNPKNPAIFLTLGRLEVAKGDNAKAKEYIVKSLQQKKNYTDAIFLLAQIQVGEGNLKEAIVSVEAATLLSPNDSGAFFQLGLLRYNVNDIVGAASAFEQAIAINPSYANAKYFLGLSYNRLDRDEEAIAQFRDLKETNPDNKEVDLILKNLKAGLNPFTNATPPIDNKPEKRSTPPVQEKAAAKTSTRSTAAGSGDDIADVGF
jgi:tetratricopeptide (TPR) repeat protein